MKRRDLLADFRAHALIRGDEAFFPLVVARQVVRRAGASDTAIVGIEAFHHEDGSLHALPGGIADFSDDAGRSPTEVLRLSVSGAEHFLETVSADYPEKSLLFTFTIADPAERQVDDT